MTTIASNRLANEQSLYLRQHDANPIDWWPYGPEAIQKAQDESKPIFLSIGYSSCHWCNVMNAESFSDPDIASSLNQNFICIKVDREEYPDLDNYYQLASQLYSRAGGWPLSAFLLSDLKPYFAGTYFPKNSDGKSAGFKEIIEEMSRVYQQDRKLVEDNASKVTEAIISGLIPKDKVEYQGHFPPPMAVMKAVEQFRDQENGGFGEPPKFPNYSFFNWAIEQMLEGMIEKDEGEFIVKSLERMLMGGIIDHPRGGVHRYCADAQWTIPHFEKMLYDQAGLLRVLSKLSLVYPSPLVFDTLINTLNFLDSEMMGENGYFFSAQNAESEGVEGLYYTYTKQEFEDALNAFDDESELLANNREKILRWFPVAEIANFDGPLNVLRFDPNYKDEIYATEGWEIVPRVLKAISQDRKDRMPPATDAKGVASWNFMLCSALIDVMQYCRIDVIRHKANDLFNRALSQTYATFVVAKDSEKVQIKHSTTRELNPPYLEDYVTFAELQMRTYEVTGNPVFKENLEKTLDYMLKEFVEGEQILTRAKFSNDFEQYPNLNIGSFDNSFRSPASMLIDLSRRAAVLFMDRELLDSLTPAIEALTHECLKNPINAGEALRALSYPQEVYRVIKVPRAWPKESKFMTQLPYFLSRFVIDYHDDGEAWQICSLDRCELQGEGIDNFVETLTPKQ